MKLAAAIALLMVVLVSGSSMCPATNCNYTPLSWNGRVCGQLSADGNTYTFNPTACANSTEYCAFTNFNLDSVCLPKDVVYAYDAYPGEKCTEAHRCASGNCVDGKCKQFTQCQNYYDCEGMQYCSGTTCLPLKTEGATCYYDHECVQYAGCDNVAEGTPGVCKRYLSLVPGTDVLSCDLSSGKTSFGRNSLCLSNFCYNFNGAYRCTESFKSTSKTYPQTCTMGTECQSEVDNVSGLAYSEPCQCGFNAHGQGYCPQFPGDPLPKELTSLRQKWLDSDDIKKCNTFSRPENNEYEWCLSSVGYHGVKKLWYKAYYQFVYPQVVAADKCYLKYVSHAYYLADEEYDSATALALAVVLALAY